jgi:hypothetical protein
MSQEIERRTRGTLSQRSEPRSEPSWRTVAATTMRLWLERHHLVNQRPAGRRSRLLVLLSALAAMGLGAVLTLVFTGTNQSASPGARLSDPAQPTALQFAADNRLAAAKWVAAQVSTSEIVSCDPEMCGEVQQQRFPPGQLMLLSPTAPDPLGSEVVIATPAIQSQFGVRLATVYAPEVLASFGSGPEQVVVRYVAPDGAAAFNAQLAEYRLKRINAGSQLLGNSNIHANATTRAQLLNGQVDPRLLVTLGYLASKISLKLVAFDDKSPGEGYVVPLRGAEISATPTGLSTILQILGDQQGSYAPAGKGLATVRGERVVAVWYGAPGPLDTGLQEFSLGEGST